MIAAFFNGPAALAQVGVHTDFPDASSAMDIYSTNKGLLIPRVTLSENLDDPSPVSSPAVGLLVFNSGANQPMGFYYWDGSLWISTSGIAGNDYWLLKGNSGTEVGTNFLGTTDEQDLAIYTNAVERMRVELDGQVVIDSTAARYANALFSVFGNASQDTAISAYSPAVGLYAEAGLYGLYSKVNNSTGGYGVYAKNANAAGYGSMTVGSNTTSGYYSGRSAGLNSWGNDGAHIYGRSAAGTGVIAAGNALIPAIIADGSGGSFIGYWGLYARSSNTNANGTGIIGLGNNLSSSYFLQNGSGGAFTGRDGVYGKSINSIGTGVIGFGNNITGNPSTLSTGSGGAFTGNDGIYGRAVNASTGIGIIALGSNNSTFYTIPGGGGGSFNGHHGILATGSNVTDGIGVIGAGNNATFIIPSTGTGGSFTGTTAGSISYGLGASATGVLGTGNNITVPFVNPTGSGGAFTGLNVGAIALGTDPTSGVGVIGSGNNTTSPSVPASGGCGGAFTGLTWGVYGYATNSGNVTRGGGYFACNPLSGGAYAYVGYRNNNQNYKTIGNGTNSTIVKNREGELITLYCPEAPEVIFQDFGTGQLIDGKTHITIDPDLSVNINVNDKHPLKVYITPEGDCNGVYVTNKSAQGFDVIELQGGKSNVPFAWQIAATRANEEYTLKDGTIEHSDYSTRFPPAPGPLEMVEQPVKPLQSTSYNTDGNENKKISESVTGELHEATGGSVIGISDKPDGK